MSRSQRIDDFAPGVRIIFDRESDDAASTNLVPGDNLSWYAVCQLDVIYQKQSNLGAGQVTVEVNKRQPNGSSNSAVWWQRAFTTTEVTTPTASLDPTAATFQQPMGNEMRSAGIGYDYLSHKLYTWDNPLIIPPTYWVKIARYTTMSRLRFEAVLLESATWAELAAALRSPHGSLRKPPGMGT